MSPETVDDANWREAWNLGCAMMKGVTRRRVSGSQPGVELAVLDWGGEGDLVVLHHANGFSGATLAPIAHALRDRFRVVAIDARGHGDSTSVSPGGGLDGYAWTTMADDLHAAISGILEFVGVPTVKLAIGHSFGGTLVLIEAQRAPARLENLVFCDPVIFPPMAEGEEQARARKSGLVEATRKRRDSFPSRAEAFAHFRSRALFANFTQEALALYVGEGLEDDPAGGVTLKCRREVEAAVFGNGASAELFANVEAVSAKARFIHASRGNFERATYDALAARMPYATVESLDVGHLYPMEEPARVLETVDALLSLD